ncbi:hypothetical protein [Roseospira visakhapatnamensis]|uniref:Transcriptional regulator with XRE-family HTH domain n=1 Tax=Roseospira visakhapatnamensis TaxID=390880 RepID=A0A7W6RGS8_9PROT|nr:hypothetical protein [Roseospira visakhapatnamensis]MBB4267706.1 transcriptional regulator with XRE-family HTH domain [Roseospira visakhapatnamensis]
MHGMTLAPSGGSPLSGGDVTEAIDAVRARFLNWVRRCPAKALARILGVPVKTVDRWREGVMPSPDSLALIAAHMGENWLTWLFGPVLDEGTLDAQLAVVALRIEEIRRDIRESDHVRSAGAAGQPDLGAAGPGASAADGRPAPAGGRTARRPGHLVAGSMLIGLVVGMGAMQVVGDADDVLLRAGSQPKVMRTMGVRDV